MKSRELAEHLDEFLRVKEIKDYRLNGLSVENKKDIKKIALAVDASLEAFNKTELMGADLLIVHHGLFNKQECLPLTGALYERIKFLIANDIGLYSVHLPLDMHPLVGNNAQATKLLGGKEGRPFANECGVNISKEIILGETLTLEELVEKIEEKFNTRTVVWKFGKDTVESIGYVSGGGISFLKEAIQLGVDTFVTGEPKHSAYWMAKEAKINCIFAGHYATETLGVKALGGYINEKFGIDVEFIGLPTGH